MILLLQRYILRDLARVFIMALAGITSVMVVGMVGQVITSGEVPAIHVVRALPLFLPVVLAYTGPATMLFAVTLVYGRFARDNEFDAVRASGIHPMVVLVPALALGAALGVGVLYLVADAIPASYYRVRNLKDSIDVVADIFFARLKSQGSYSTLDGEYIIWADAVEANTAYDVRIEKRDRERRPEVAIQAKSATFRFEPETMEVAVTTEDARVEALRGNEAARVEAHRTYTRRFPLPRPPGRKPRDQPLVALFQQLAEANQRLRAGQGGAAAPIPLALATGSAAAPDRRDPAEVRREVLNEMHLRFNLAASPLSFVLVGVPLAMWFRRGHILAAFLVALGPMLLFYLLHMVGKHLTTTGHWPPYTPWAANAALVILAVVLLARLFRQ